MYSNLFHNSILSKVIFSLIKKPVYIRRLSTKIVLQILWNYSGYIKNLWEKGRRRSNIIEKALSPASQTSYSNSTIRSKWNVESTTCKMIFFLSVLKRIFPPNDIFQIQILKSQIYIYKTRPLNSLKNSNLCSILVASQKL